VHARTKQIKRFVFVFRLSSCTAQQKRWRAQVHTTRSYHQPCKLMCRQDRLDDSIACKTRTDYKTIALIIRGGKNGVAKTTWQERRQVGCSHASFGRPAAASAISWTAAVACAMTCGTSSECAFKNWAILNAASASSWHSEKTCSASRLCTATSTW